MKDRKAFLMRVDPTLLAELESWAQEEVRSMNGQIEMILRQAIQDRGGLPALQRTVDESRENPELVSK
jgi:hypothetical protein